MLQILQNVCQDIDVEVVSFVNSSTGREVRVETRTSLRMKKNSNINERHNEVCSWKKYIIYLSKSDV